MSALKRLAASAALMVLAAGDARAADAPKASSPSAESALRGWDFALRAGYGVAMTNGLSYSRFGVGAAAGYRIGPRLRLEATALYSSGESIRASNAAMVYQSSSASAHGAVGIGYELALGPILLRPALRAGALAVEGSVDVGASRLSDLRLYPIVGPSVTILARLGLLQIGIDGEAFFLPTWVAAPTGGLYGFAGVAF